MTNATLPRGDAGAAMSAFTPANHLAVAGGAGVDHAKSSPTAVATDQAPVVQRFLRTLARVSLHSVLPQEFGKSNRSTTAGLLLSLQGRGHLPSIQRFPEAVIESSASTVSLLILVCIAVSSL